MMNGTNPIPSNDAAIVRARTSETSPTEATPELSKNPVETSKSVLDHLSSRGFSKLAVLLATGALVFQGLPRKGFELQAPGQQRSELAIEGEFENDRILELELTERTNHSVSSDAETGPYEIIFQKDVSISSPTSRTEMTHRRNQQSETHEVYTTRSHETLDHALVTLESLPEASKRIGAPLSYASAEDLIADVQEHYGKLDKVDQLRVQGRVIDSLTEISGYIAEDILDETGAAERGSLYKYEYEKINEVMSAGSTLVAIGELLVELREGPVLRDNVSLITDLERTQRELAAESFPTIIENLMDEAQTDAFHGYGDQHSRLLTWVQTSEELADQLSMSFSSTVRDVITEDSQREVRNDKGFLSGALDHVRLWRLSFSEKCIQTGLQDSLAELEAAPLNNIIDLSPEDLEPGVSTHDLEFQSAAENLFSVEKEFRTNPSANTLITYLEALSSTDKIRITQHVKDFALGALTIPFEINGEDLQDIQEIAIEGMGLSEGLTRRGSARGYFEEHQAFFQDIFELAHDLQEDRPTPSGPLEHQEGAHALESYEALKAYRYAQSSDGDPSFVASTFIRLIESYASNGLYELEQPEIPKLQEILTAEQAETVRDLAKNQRDTTWDQRKKHFWAEVYDDASRHPEHLESYLEELQVEQEIRAAQFQAKREEQAERWREYEQQQSEAREESYRGEEGGRIRLIKPFFSF